ncbi:NAD(P)/FAD-dependent oxidoreductase [Halolamina pelagica]|uniref:NAD(P)/FAD-dependent oxidoreductase n=1 Tax=Halolamina pelagica TaxID=699431 RepID=UPI0006CA61F2|nr:FAD-dependent oxidoreductase [Halolamina pelagica]
MTSIGVVGAGVAAAAATFVVDEARPNADVTVLEKSGGLGGRAATRRHDDLTYDYGANYVKSASERVSDLLTEQLDDDGLVDVAERVYTFDEHGEVTPGREPDGHKWSYRAGLTQIAKRLFARTGAAVHRRTRVETVRRDPAAGTWTLVDADGESWGPFDAVVLNPPAPQTADLLRGSEWESPVKAALVDAIADVPFRTIWTAVLHYPFELDRPYYALVNTDKEHAVGWISREECKPGHVPDGESLLVVQANHDWSVERYDDDPTANVDALAAHAAEIVGDDRLTDPDWTDHQGWRYALTAGSALAGPLDSAEDAGLYCTGDWVAGEARVHAALENGLEVGEKLAFGL